MSILFVISGPSGAGKSTLLKEVMALDSGLTFSISYTTRAPRGHEQHGVNYFFTTVQDFEARIAAGEFLEHAQVFGKDYYGTNRSELRRAAEAGKDVVMDIDVQGAAQLRERVPGAVLIFVVPPSLAELEARLRARKEDKEEKILRRLAEARLEVAEAEKYDYILVNGQLPAAVAELRSIIVAERLRRAKAAPAVQAVLASFAGQSSAS